MPEKNGIVTPPPPPNTCGRYEENGVRGAIGNGEDEQNTIKKRYDKEK